MDGSDGAVGQFQGVALRAFPNPFEDMSDEAGGLYGTARDLLPRLKAIDAIIRLERDLAIAPT